MRLSRALSLGRTGLLLRLQSLLKDWPWKVAALGIGLFLFFVIRQSVSHTQTLSLTVEATVAGGEHALRGFEPAAVRVTFRGSESEIRRLSLKGSEPPRVTVRLNQPPPGVTEVPVTVSRRNVSYDGDLHIVSVEPSRVIAEFDTRETRYFNVEQPLVRGETNTSKFSVTIDPSYVEVTGPRERLDELVEQAIELPTEVLDATGRTEDFSVALRVLPPDTRSSWTMNPATVRADVRILREETKCTIEDVNVRVLQSDTGLRFMPEPKTVSLTIEGVKEELDALRDESFTVVVDPAHPSDAPDTVETSKHPDAFWSLPQLIFPYNRHVKTIEITPEKIQLIPLSPTTHASAASEEKPALERAIPETSERSPSK